MIWYICTVKEVNKGSDFNQIANMQIYIVYCQMKALRFFKSLLAIFERGSVSEQLILIRLHYWYSNGNLIMHAAWHWLTWIFFIWKCKIVYFFFSWTDVWMCKKEHIQSTILANRAWTKSPKSRWVGPWLVS